MSHRQFLASDRVPPGHFRLAATLLALALLLTACFGDGAEEIQEVAQGDADAAVGYPDWIDSVYPMPGSESSATQAVQVRHTVVTAERQVRLTH